MASNVKAALWKQLAQRPISWLIIPVNEVKCLILNEKHPDSCEVFLTEKIGLCQTGSYPYTPVAINIVSQQQKVFGRPLPYHRIGITSHPHLQQNDRLQVICQAICQSPFLAILQTLGCRLWGILNNSW